MAENVAKSRSSRVTGRIFFYLAVVILLFFVLFPIFHFPSHFMPCPRILCKRVKKQKLPHTKAASFFRIFSTLWYLIYLSYPSSFVS